MKSRFRRLALAAALSTTVAPMAFAEEGKFVGDKYAEYFRDSEGPRVALATVGDLKKESSASKDYVGDEVRRVAGTDPIVDPTTPAPALKPLSEVGTPVAMSGTVGSTASIGTTIAGECAPCEQMPCEALRSTVLCGRQDYWMRAELLLWFPQGRTTPPMGVRTDPQTLPYLGDPTAEAFGESYGNDLVPGFRGDVGRYFGGGNYGLGGRVWVLGEDDDDFNFGGDGSTESLGIPFYNTYPPALGEDALIVGFDNLAGNQFVGDATVSSSLSIVAAELYGRALLGSSCRHRFELIGGYSHFNIEDHFGLSAESVELPVGELTTFRDDFDTRNEFHGGQLGSEFTLNRGRWLASSLTKVHLGNMSQTATVVGASSQEVIGSGVLNSFDQGLFARGDALGTRQQDVFAFAPEMNLRLGYRFRQHVSFHVGYSFIYWNNVALASDLIDRNIYVDKSNLGDAGPARAPRSLSGSGLWVQGIDLGATLTF
jgi:hypothetical protein